ncbi:LOW QUALITY PROTEIN: acyl carrier protein-like [Rhodamnia argentea]|uniref:Acyl carrier protein n=1 Tax=Rhodamnia argentea TaxID=178133 RepID=A0ABM3GVN7_9MYRT|nr:LOW QUALITY PROTEIN: acyl carrier protein-like [Rhodamnia argentea]
MASASLSTPRLPALQSVRRARGGARQLGSLSAISGKIRLVPKIAIAKVGIAFAPILVLSRNQISCSAAKPDTLKTVQGIIAKQFSVDESTVAPETKFADLGADSLGTVEIVMALEETFRVSMRRGAENIVTVQDAADLIEKVKAGSA